jgi:hypothetical protein
MGNFFQKLIEGMEYYAKSFTITGNADLSSTSFQSSSNKQDIKTKNIHTLIGPQHNLFN